MPDDPLTSALDEYAAFFEAEAAREKQNTWHVGAARRKGEKLLAAVGVAVDKVHAPVPIYQIALHGHAPDPGASFTLHCGHPAPALEDDRHAESDEGDWICLDQVFRIACGGCRDDEGELADFGNCATRAAITRELTGKDGTDDA